MYLLVISCSSVVLSIQCSETTAISNLKKICLCLVNQPGRIRTILQLDCDMCDQLQLVEKELSGMKTSCNHTAIELLHYQVIEQIAYRINTQIAVLLLQQFCVWSCWKYVAISHTSASTTKHIAWTRGIVRPDWNLKLMNPSVYFQYIDLMAVVCS